MAGARVLDQEYPDVQATGAPGNDYQHIETTPNMFGGAIAGAEEKLGQGAQQASNAAYQTADFYGKITADDRTNTFNDRQLKRFYGDPNDPSKPGLFQLKGSAAMLAWPKVLAENEADRQSLGAGLSPSARLNFETDTRRSALGMQEAAGRYTDSQFNEYATTTLNSKMDIAIRNIGTMYNDDSAYKSNLQDGMNAVAKTALKNGVDPNTPDGKAILDNEYANFHAKAIVARVEGLQNESSSKARAFLESNKDQLDSKTYDAMVTRLRPMQAADIGANAFSGVPKNTGGFDRDHYNRVVQSIEDPSGDPTIRNASGHQGLFQFGDPEWAKYGGGADRNDPAAQVRAQNAYTDDHRAQLTKILGRVPTEAETYLAHQQGVGGATRLMADPMAKAADIVGRAAIVGNIPKGANPDMSAGEFVALWENRFNSGKFGAAPAFAKAESTAPTAGNSGPLPVSQTSYSTSAPNDPANLTAPVTPAASPDDTYGMPDRDAALRNAKEAAGDDQILQKMAMADVNRRYSELQSLTYAQRYQLEQKIPDYMAAASAGADIQLPVNEIKANFPQPKADSIIQKFATAQQVGQVLKGVEFASPAELSKIQGDLSSGMGVLSDIIHPHKGAASTGPGSITPVGIQDSPDEFVVRRAALGKVQQEIEKRDAILFGPNADPAAYAALHPSAQAALASVDPKNPGTFENYASTTLALQKYLGVPDTLQHVLTRGQAMNLSGQIENSDDPKATFQQLQQQFGNAWPHVFHDAISLGKLAPGYQAVAALDDPHDAALLSRTLAQQKPKPDGKPSTQLDDIVNTITRTGNAGGKPDSTLIRDGVRNDTDMTAYVSSIRRSGASDEQIEGIINSVQTLALAKRANGEATSAGGAAAAAIKSFFGKFDYMPNGGARVPSDKFDAVSANAQAALSSVTENDIAVPTVFGMNVPPDAEGKGGYIGPDKSEYLGMLKAAPTWITSPKGDSLWLLDHEGRMVRTNDGKPFEVRFDTPKPQLPTSAPPSATNYQIPPAPNAPPGPHNYQIPAAKSAPGFGAAQ